MCGEPMAIEHKTRTQLVLEAIREKILKGEIKAGEPLRQAALAESLNVSRIPVREALVQLEAEGLVNFEPHKGATVSMISATQVDEVFELRALLESELLKYSIPQLTDEDYAEANSLIEHMADVGYHDPAQGELNYRFHHVLYGKANRPHTLELADILIKNSLRFVQIHLTLAGGDARSQAEHTELVSLCQGQKIEQACDFLKQHILNAKHDIIALLDE